MYADLATKPYSTICDKSDSVYSFSSKKRGPNKLFIHRPSLRITKYIFS